MAEEKKNTNIPYEEEKDGIPAPATEPQLTVEYNLLDLFNELDKDPAETPVNNEEPKGAKQPEFPTEHDDPFADLNPNELFTDEESPKKPEQPVPAPDYSETYPDYAKEKKQGLDYFDEALSAEELAARYINALAMYDDRENVVMNVKGVEMELVKEEYDNAAKKAARMDPNQFKDSIKGANVYINGVQKNINELIAFIEANKVEFVAACKVAFPDIDERVAKKMREEAEKAEQSRSGKEKKGRLRLHLNLGKKDKEPKPAAEKKGLSFIFKRNGKKLEPPTEPTPVVKESIPIELPHEETGKYVTEAEKKTAEAKNNNVQNTTPHQPTEAQKQVFQPAPEVPPVPQIPPKLKFEERVAAAISHNEMESVTQFFDNAKKYMQADFYLRNPQTDDIDHVITLKRTGDDKRIIIDGKNALESDLKKLINEYPGQMKPQIDAATKAMSQSKGGKPRSESPAKE